MKRNYFLNIVALAAILAPVAPAQALSCLPTDMYLKDIVGKEEVIVMVGTIEDQIVERDYTAEVLAVSEVWQGYAEMQTFVYHQNDETWGFMCSQGPAKEGDESVYVASKDSNGKLSVHQRLDVDDEMVTELQKDLEDAEVWSSLGETTKRDRLNQIKTTIADLIKAVQLLVKEFRYWSAS